jgi:hypothetical protein
MRGQAAFSDPSQIVHLAAAFLIKGHMLQSCAPVSFGSIPLKILYNYLILPDIHRLILLQKQHGKTN